MNKRKILTLALAVAMVAILAVGGSLAYLTDTDAQTNTFVTGNVAIDLFEDFGDNDPDTLEKLLPTTGTDDEGKQINGIEKEVYVKNTGSEPAYVRVHIAIPDLLDSGAKDEPALAAYDNIVHMNMSYASIAKGEWSWLPTYTEGVGYDGNGAGKWNVYEEKIGEIDYNVYVVTYRTALAGVTTEEETIENEDGTTSTVTKTIYDVTPDAIWQVYMDANTTNEQIATLVEKLGAQWNIYVAAEAAQEQGFDNAYEALNEAFGDPQAEDYETKVDWNAIAEGSTWVDWISSKGF